MLRHGKRSGRLSNDKVDVVDHDVDIMVGIASHEDWIRKRFGVQDRLVERGWSHCFERYSVAIERHSNDKEFLLVRGDLFLCVRYNPQFTLDIGTYLTEGSIAYAQKYCIPGSGCWLRLGCFSAGSLDLAQPLNTPHRTLQASGHLVPTSTDRLKV